MKTDTIAAIATAVSDSGIGIIRISGDEAIDIADKIYRSKKNNKRLKDVKSHTINYGFIVDASNNELIDEVMVAVMKSPNTYTKEDTVEIDCHGGILVMNRILETVLKNGCRLAEPGEFTKRAFLNGRIDLSKAEAVMDIIHSKNEFALKSSINQLKGAVSDKVKSLREDILYEIAFIESALDDPEHISLDGYHDKLEQKSLLISAELKKLIDSADNGKMLKDGINTVIVGKPNAGKSSLLNVLVGEDKAIVTSVAGTTRDVLEESIKLHGVGLNIIDTAGIRDTSDEVEKIGVEKARKYAGNADLVIYVVDSSVPLDENDEEIIKLIAEKKIIVLLNKTDLDSKVSQEDIYEVFSNVIEAYDKKDITVIKTSTKENIGIDEFELSIKNMFFNGKIAVNDEIYITSQRHKEALIEAYDSMQLVLSSLADYMPEDFYSIDLMSAYASLGRIIGEEVGEDLVNEIFSKFCMGK
ncbi:MAG: tRNA uridine-5-carboxymethylaminomethyl(34) synthesis GTPase MnmE [Lachnospiraceae bacterium]|nr:tRNA uridine-5-carboxymethylaminomethyl(34) synthesis GTPase MnmE [Lachnospiraceae bacterium]MEE0920193.1 tRNA uridine-5-carboxymethylaminomethyl(34) synthesis GTPase MnmE [Lachnospiraceae bacterium]